MATIELTLSSDKDIPNGEVFCDLEDIRGDLEQYLDETNNKYTKEYLEAFDNGGEYYSNALDYSFYVFVDSESY